MVRKVFLLLFILALAGCGSGDGSAEATTKIDDGTAAADPARPEFDLERIEGGRLRLSELRGKIVVVDFWDTWCPPCRQAIPHLQQLSVEHADDVVVVGVAVGRMGKQAVADFVKQNGVTFPVVLLDDQGAAVRAFGGFDSLPTTFIVDADGVVRERIVGFDPRNASVYETAIGKLTGA